MGSDNRDNGFSLIEVLIVATVILATTGLALASYSSFNDSEQLRQAARTLKNDLRFVQTRAATGVKPTGCETLITYRVTFTESSYAYEPICTNALASSSRTVNLPRGVRFITPPAQPMDFAVLTGTVTNGGILSLQSKTNTNNIEVSTNGDINDSGFIGPYE